MTVKMNIFSLIFRLVFLRKISHSRSHEQTLIFLFIFIDTVLQAFIVFTQDTQHLSRVKAE